MAKKSYRVVKGGCYFSAGENGKPAPLEVGTDVSLEDKQAEKLEARGFVVAVKPAKTMTAAEKKAADATPPPLAK